GAMRMRWSKHGQNDEEMGSQLIWLFHDHLVQPGGVIPCPGVLWSGHLLRCDRLAATGATARTPHDQRHLQLHADAVAQRDLWYHPRHRSGAAAADPGPSSGNADDHADLYPGSELRRDGPIRAGADDSVSQTEARAPRRSWRRGTERRRRVRALCG